MSYSIPQVRKAVVAWVGAALILLNSALEVFADYLPANASHWVSVVIGVVTAVSVFLVRNAQVIDSLPRPDAPPTV